MNSRLDFREKKRKINRIYNIAITVVLLLIVIVSITIVTGNDVEQTAQETKDTAQTNKTSQTNTEVDHKETDAVESIEQVEEEEISNVPEFVKVEGSGDTNVVNTYISESWKPIGTEQTGVHTTSFEKGSVDWNEMTKAIAYGAGIDEASMHLWWLNNGGASNTAVGTVSAGDNPQSFRVYIEWIDGEGWKPTKVEELKDNDKR